MREKENKINRPLFSSLFWEFVTDFTAFSPLNLFAGLFLPPQLKKLSPIFCSPLQRQDLLWKSHLSCKGCGFTALFKKPLISFAFISSSNSTVFSCNFLFTGWYHCNKMQLFGMGFFFLLFKSCHIYQVLRRGRGKQSNLLRKSISHKILSKMIQTWFSFGFLRSFLLLLILQAPRKKKISTSPFHERKKINQNI